MHPSFNADLAQEFLDKTLRLCEPCILHSTTLHYNPPYGDMFMEIREDHRYKGLGTFIIQEMKRACYQYKHVPAARCSVDPGDSRSRATLLKAGMRICGYKLRGTIRK